MTLSYARNDERPAWVATVTVNGTADDMTTGYTFTVRVATSSSATAVLTKTSGITGGTDGQVTVAWAAGELDIAPGSYVAVLTARRTADNLDWSISSPLTIHPIPS